MVVLVGVDSGATKTEAVVLIGGALSAVHVSGPSNVASVGPDAACGNLREVLGKIRTSVDAVGIGSAGYLGGGLDHFFSQCLSGLVDAPIVVFEDVEVAHASAFLFGDGVVGILGTGSNFLGVRRGARVKAGGWGHLLGDEGGAYHIGREALRAALRELEGLEEGGELAAAALAHFGAGDAISLLRRIYLSRDPKGLIASFAPRVFELARAGGVKARAVIEAAAEAAAEYIIAIFKRLGGPAPVSLTGSVYLNNEDVLAPLIRRALGAAGYDVEIQRPAMRQSCAAALMAAGRLGILTEDIIKAAVDSCGL